MQRLLTETKQKLDHYKNEIEKAASNVQKIKSMEKLLSDYRIEKDGAMKQFETFKKECQQKENDIKKQHVAKLTNIGQEVSDVKKNFEQRIKQLEEETLTVQKEKLKIIAELEQRHQQEIEKVLLDQSKGRDEAKDAVEKRHLAEIEKLKDKLDKLETDKNQDLQNFEAKLAKQKAFYDKELEAMKSAAAASGEEQLRIAQAKIVQLEKDLLFSESQLKNRVDSLLQQIDALETDVTKIKAENVVLGKQLSNYESDNNKLQQQVNQLL